MTPPDQQTIDQPVDQAADAQPSAADPEPEVTVIGGRRAIRLDQRDHAPRLARREVADMCREDLPEAVIADLQLITSELVTNAIEHGDNGVVTLDIKYGAEEVTVIVTSSGAFSETAPKTEWALPDVTQRSGRGLALARELAERVEIHVGEGMGDGLRWIAVSATLRLE